MAAREKVMFLFDVDGTLTKPRLPISEDFVAFLIDKVKPLTTIGLVGGSDFTKISEQMRGADVAHQFDYVFSENGLLAFQNGAEIGRESIQMHLGEQKLQEFINFSLKCLADIRLPCKRGTFIEFRTGMLNISPIGRSCSREERNNFEVYDREHQVRARLIETLQNKFPDYGLKYSIGGQISFDVFPQGWDKTYCLKYLVQHFDKIHFFGDKTDVGGNDYEIYNDSRVIGHRVCSPEDTKQQLESLLHL